MADDVLWHLEHDDAPMLEKRGPNANDYLAFEAWQAATLDRDMHIAREIRLLANREFRQRAVAIYRQNQARRARAWLMAGWIAVCVSAAVFAYLIFWAL